MNLTWPQLPYEIIGKAATLIVAIAVFVLLLLVAYIVSYVVWCRVLTKLINLCWYGYDITGEHPPRWRREIAIFLHCLKRGNFEKYKEKRDGLDDLEGREE